MPGPARRPSLAVVREGNPGKRPVPDQVAVPPADFSEPSWFDEFPDTKVPRAPIRPVRKSGEDAESWTDRMDRYETRLSRWELKRSAAEGATYCRAKATDTWQRTVPVLEKTVGLGNVDYATVVDMCVCVARLNWCERRLSIEGLVTMGQRGPCRNPLTTVATQYRTQLKTYIRELGLSPAARSSLASKPPDDDDDEDPFD